MQAERETEIERDRKKKQGHIFICKYMKRKREIERDREGKAETKR